MIRQSWRPLLQSAAVIAAAAAAAGCVGTARADEVATIHPEAKVRSPSTVRWFCNHIYKPSFASYVVLCCSLGKFCHCPQGNGRSSSMKSGSGTSVGLTRSLNILQPRQNKTVQGLFHLGLAGSWLCSRSHRTDNSTCDIASLPSHVPPTPALRRTGRLCTQQHQSPCRQNTHFRRLEMVQFTD